MFHFMAKKRSAARHTQQRRLRKGGNGLEKHSQIVAERRGGWYGVNSPISFGFVEEEEDDEEEYHKDKGSEQISFYYSITLGPTAILCII